MSRFEWSRFPSAEIAQVPEAGMPLKYVIPYDWGSLRVSERANQAYGLTPLVGNMAKDNFPEPGQAEIPFSVDIWLLSPDELEISKQDTGINPIDGIDISGVSLPFLHRGGVGLKVGLQHDNESVREIVKKSVAEAFGLDEDELNDVVDEGDVPIEESLDSELAHLSSHVLTGLVQDQVQEPIEEWLRRREGKQFLGAIGMNAAAGIVVGSAYLGGEYISSSLFGNYSPTTVFLGAIAATGMFAGSMLYEHTATANSREKTSKQVVRLFANKIANDIHETYCTTHFDQNAKDWPVIDDPDEPK